MTASQKSMSSQSTLELAKQGDAEAIATLINRSIQAKGIKATADINPARPQCLNIDLRSPQKINQKAMVSLVRKGMLSLQVERIKQLAISAYHSDYETASDNEIWQVDFDLESSESLSDRVPSQLEAVPAPLSAVAPLVHQPVQIEHIPQAYQDIIIRFTDPHYGNVKCLCTLTELIQVINNFSFGDANPALKNLLEAIAESTTIEDGDRIINNISVLQPGSQWQKAKIRLVVKIFFEAEGYVPPVADSVSNKNVLDIITLEASKSLPESLEAIATVSIQDKATETKAKSEPVTPVDETVIEAAKTPKQILLEDLSSLLTDMTKPDAATISDSSDRPTQSLQKEGVKQTDDAITLEEFSKW